MENNSHNRHLNGEAQQLMEYFASIYETKALVGYNIYGHSPDLYNQVGKHGAIWSKDLRWIKNPEQLIEETIDNGFILTIHWHWPFMNDSAWIKKRKTKFNINNIVSKGTPENIAFYLELQEAADKLAVFNEKGIPVLWRPFHEIDGNWFWWSFPDNPGITAQLWRMMFDYFVHERKLNNLIWVYSAATGKNRTLEYRKAFYPGTEYVDILGIDIYGLDSDKLFSDYQGYFDVIHELDASKMIALTESEFIPDPKHMANGKAPVWLYVLPWEGVPSRKRKIDDTVEKLKHKNLITLSQLPQQYDETTKPFVGISPPKQEQKFDKDSPIKLNFFTSDYNNDLKEIRILANDQQIGVVSPDTESFDWVPGEPGNYTIELEAEDSKGNLRKSNSIFLLYDLFDVAERKKAFVSSGKNPEFSVDGDIETSWISAKNDKESIYIDLEAPYLLNNIILTWGWKIHPEALSVYTGEIDKDDKIIWELATKLDGIEYQTWSSRQIIYFKAIEARFVKVELHKRASNQTWGGYNLSSFQIPISTNSRSSISPIKSNFPPLVILPLFLVIVIFSLIRFKKQQGKYTKEY